MRNLLACWHVLTSNKVGWAWFEERLTCGYWISAKDRSLYVCTNSKFVEFTVLCKKSIIMR